MEHPIIGINIKGLHTIVPYTNGSLMLNSEGINVAFHNVLNFLLLANSIMIAKGNVAP